MDEHTSSTRSLMSCTLLPKRQTNPDLPADYGKSCKAWDADACDKWWPDVKRGGWCCQPWCYVPKECPDAYESELSPGLYFSYKKAGMCVGARGSTWEHVGACGSTWEHVGARGSTREHVGARKYCGRHMYWCVLDSFRSCWVHLWAKTIEMIKPMIPKCTQND